MLTANEKVPETTVIDRIKFLFDEHHSMVFRAAYRVTGREDDAEDVLQTVFLKLLQLEEWHHPDVVDDEERPSGSETFAQLAAVLSSGELAHYRPTRPPNTHWVNWPDGGTL